MLPERMLLKAKETLQLILAFCDSNALFLITSSQQSHFGYLCTLSAGKFISPPTKKNNEHANKDINMTTVEQNGRTTNNTNGQTPFSMPTLVSANKTKQTTSTIPHTGDTAVQNKLTHTEKRKQKKKLTPPIQRGGGSEQSPSPLNKNQKNNRLFPLSINPQDNATATALRKSHKYKKNLPSSSPFRACCRGCRGQTRSLPGCGRTPQASEPRQRSRYTRTPKSTAGSAASRRTPQRRRARRWTIPVCTPSAKNNKRHQHYTSCRTAGSLSGVDMPLFVATTVLRQINANAWASTIIFDVGSPAIPLSGEKIMGVYGQPLLATPDISFWLHVSFKKTKRKTSIQPPIFC